MQRQTSNISRPCFGRMWLGTKTGTRKPSRRGTNTNRQQNLIGSRLRAAPVKDLHRFVANSPFPTPSNPPPPPRPKPRQRPPTRLPGSLPNSPERGIEEHRVPLRRRLRVHRSQGALPLRRLNERRARRRAVCAGVGTPGAVCADLAPPKVAVCHLAVPRATFGGPTTFQRMGASQNIYHARSVRFRLKAKFATNKRY